MEIVWRNVILFAALHIGAVIGFYQMLFVAKWATVMWVIFLHVAGAIGITAGAHRLWSHKAYKANLPYRILLMIMDTTAFQLLMKANQLDCLPSILLLTCRSLSEISQPTPKRWNDIIEWARDHRCHHKWTDTHADPHNTNRGFFFSHMGWLLVKKHPQIKEQGKKLDLSDLLADPVLVFQRKYSLPMVILFCFLLPTVIPVRFWGESPLVAFYTAALFRYCFLLHSTWFINSVAHM
ncbi:stearoyl-CoA 9-desaturase [Oesophagostomum dentatum]|uniref:Stearoyl-CoA 9-desaturase n=1 Tax=Oesophagostomum dentatum TaxID=61180 RepID=A0A0B1T8R9_OESDE|nr:stearoyl-CoA 9-desaturase [Oesophagostomum dentatum]